MFSKFFNVFKITLDLTWILKANVSNHVICTSSSLNVAKIDGGEIFLQAHVVLVKEVLQKLPFNKMIGIGWFECECGRTYKGKARGDVTSKCHNCQAENLPSFILPGDSAKKEQPTDKRHYCSECKGSANCPISSQILNSNKNVSKFSKYFSRPERTMTRFNVFTIIFFILMFIIFIILTHQFLRKFIVYRMFYFLLTG